MSDLNQLLSLIIIVVIVLWLLAVLDDGVKDGSKILFVFLLGFIVIGTLTIVSFFAVSYILHLTLGI